MPAANLLEIKTSTAAKPVAVAAEPFMPPVFWPGLATFLCLVLSLYCLPAAHQVVKVVDFSCVYCLNQFIGKDVAIDQIFAFFNTRVGDICVLGGVCLLVLTHALSSKNLDETVRRLSLAIYLAIWGLFVYVVVCTAMNILFPRLTPITALPLHDVQKLYGVKLRSSAIHSFPSGHALAYSLFALGSAPRYPCLALIYAIFGTVMLTIRLMLGLHWLSDILLGSLPLTLLVVAVGQQPICVKAYDYVERLVNLGLAAMKSKRTRLAQIERD